MKRLLSFLLISAMIFSLCACGGQETASAPGSGSDAETVQSTAAMQSTEPSQTVPDSPLLRSLYDGIYVLDTSELEVPCEEVLLDLNLTDMTFALKCYDGNVVTGSLEAGQEYLYCWFEGGCIAFDVMGSALHVCYPENVGQSYLMYCPQTSFDYAHVFRYDANRTDILTPSGSDFLEDKKVLAEARYNFTCPVEGVERSFCYVSILYYGVTDTWELLRGSEYTPLEAVQSPDGTLVLSAGDQKWNFHYENNGLIFDGGSPLEAYGEMSEGTPKYTAALKAGDYFQPDSLHHLYDTIYVVPGADGGYDAILMLDMEYQRLLIQCSDGSILEAPYTYTNGSLRFPMGTHNAYLTYGGHSLYMSNPHNLTIVEGKDNFWFIPAADPVDVTKDFRFMINVPEEQTVPQGSILVYEEYTSVVSYPGMMLHGGLLLCTHDNTFEFNFQYCSFNVKGTYEEADGTITLVYPEGSTTLHPRDGAMEVGSGDLLYLSGMPFTSVALTRQEFAEGARIPLYEQGWLYDGTYTFTAEEGTGTITFDTENRTFTLTDAYGRVYEGDFVLDYKFVYCNAPDRSFQLIPMGEQVRLNQSEGEKVVPVENNYIFFDFSR